MALTSRKTKSRQESLRRNERKWTATLMDAGWTVLPSIILERQQALGLDAVDVNILLHLARHWWHADSLPHPSKRTVAECMNIDVSTVRRRIAALEASGFIRRKPRFDPKYGQTSNEYDFTGLIEAATPYALEVLEERKERQKEHAARRTRKRPILRVISNETVGG
jgi:DNA-binding transcriptional regulator YhcF (GntR family)